MKDVFKLAGNVIKAEIKEDKSGKSRGMGVVTFETPLEAVQAVCILLLMAMEIITLLLIVRYQRPHISAI